MRSIYSVLTELNSPQPWLAEWEPSPRHGRISRDRFCIANPSHGIFPAYIRPARLWGSLPRTASSPPLPGKPFPVRFGIILGADIVVRHTQSAVLYCSLCASSPWERAAPMPMTVESNGVQGRVEDWLILEKRLTLQFQLRQR